MQTEHKFLGPCVNQQTSCDCLLLILTSQLVAVCTGVTLIAPSPVVQRHLRLTVGERTTFAGSIRLGFNTKHITQAHHRPARPLRVLSNHRALPHLGILHIQQALHLREVLYITTCEQIFIIRDSPSTYDPTTHEQIIVIGDSTSGDMADSTVIFYFIEVTAS